MGALEYSVALAGNLSSAEVSAWSALTASTPAFASPFLRPEYTLCAAAVLASVEVCLIRDGHRTVGFFPFERLESTIGRPVGGRMQNCQAVIAEPETPWTAEHLARACGLDELEFHHQLPSQPQFAPYTERLDAAPFVELAQGWPDYLAQRERAGVASFNSLPRKIKRLERDLGPLTFVAHTAERDVFARLVEWKKAQYARTNSSGSLSNEQSVAMLHRLSATDGPGFAGLLSALYAGSRLVAVHMGIRSATVWYYWYPAYDQAFARYSPGLILMYEMCRWAAHHSLHRIDLGPGDGAHKDLFRTAHTALAVGRVVVHRADRPLAADADAATGF